MRGRNERTGSVQQFLHGKTNDLTCDAWWIIPSGISKSFITPDKLIRVDKDMNVVEGPAGYKPSSEMKMHMRCYEEREDVGAVVHAHPPTATGYAVASKPRSPILNASEMFAPGTSSSTRRGRT